MYTVHTYAKLTVKFIYFYFFANALHIFLEFSSLKCRHESITLEGIIGCKRIKNKVGIIGHIHMDQIYSGFKVEVHVMFTEE